MVDKGTQIRDELSLLGQEGREMVKTAVDAFSEHEGGSLLPVNDYERWYSRALPAVTQVMADRVDEFRDAYSTRRSKFDAQTFRISDAITGLSPSGPSESWRKYRAIALFNRQVNIVESALDRLDSVLADIRGTLEAELFDDELAAARVLLARGHLRAGGALAGVVLERHLGRVASNHGIKIRKTNPTIADLNDPLKEAAVYDLPTWRKTQHLADLRNLAVHQKQREPTSDEMDELIRGVDWIVKNVF